MSSHYPTTPHKIQILLGLIALVLFASVLVVYRPIREKRAEQRCRSNLEQIGRALAQYHQQYGSFPPAYVTDEEGKPAHSWRVLLLPFLGRQDLYGAYDFNEPWDGTHNSKLASRIPSVYACPSDREKGHDVTNYLAVVGSTTAWPGARPVTLREIRDGPANTVAILESYNPSIHWMEPRDLTSRQAKAGVNTQLKPGFSSAHGPRAHALFCNGTVRGINNEVERASLRSLLTIQRGHPIDGIPWPDEIPESVEEFPPTTPASALANTEILPDTAGPIEPGKNYVYCATFSLAWRVLQDRIGGPIELEGSPPMATALNSHVFPRSDLAEDSYVALGGSVRDGIIKEIDDLLGEKFPSAQYRRPPAPENTAFYLYSYLEKNLPFRIPFDTLDKPLVFHSRTRNASVASFGVLEGESYSEAEAQVRVLDYKSDNDFVVRLDTEKDQIVLAKVTPQDSLRETVDAVRKRVHDRSATYKWKSLEENESFVVPKIRLSVERTYSELIGRFCENNGWTGFYVAGATQGIRFLLNERGAQLESEAIFGGAGLLPTQPRHFVFDNPFLLYLQERETAEPYFVMWIENTELMEEIGKR